MKTLINLSSKILDYIWFYLAGFLILDLFEADLYLYLFVPLFAILLEMVCIKFFRTTLGKILFGIRYEGEMTWKKALRLALRPTYDTRKLPKKLPYALLIALATTVSTLTIVPEGFLFKKDRIQMFGGMGSGNISTDKWSKVTPENNRFTALFPKEPDFSEKTFAANSKNLLYKEYISNDNLTYSIGHTDLPRSWTKWGAKRVFQGCHKAVAKHFSVKYKQSASHASYPAYEYEMSDAKKKYLGKLVLVKDTLYRVEVSKEGVFSDEEMAQANVFFNSFNPK